MMARRGVNFFEEHFLFSNRLVQSILNLRSDQNSKMPMCIFCTVIFYILPGIVHQFYQLLTSKIILESPIRVLQIIMTSICLITAYSTTYFRFATLKSLFARFVLDWELSSDEIELHFMEKYTKENKSYVYFILVLFYVYAILILSPCILKVFLYLFGTLDDNKLTLFVPVNNITNAGVLYYCLLIYQILVLIIVTTIGSISFSGYLILVQHAIYQLNVIIFKVRQPFKKHSKYMQRICYFRTPRIEWDWMVDIIIRYKNFSEYVDLLNEFSKITYLFVVFLAMILIVFDYAYIFQLFIISQNVIEIIECSTYIVTSISTIYINFYFGQKLLNYSDAVFDELSKIPFYNLSIKYQKLLLFILMRSGKPCVLSIGGMFVSSHESFAALICKAFSLATVCYSVQ